MSPTTLEKIDPTDSKAILLHACELEAKLKEALDWLENAPISYANGNTYHGMDEGDVVGWRSHNELVKEIKEVLGA